jgi:RNA polymerase sigma-70 factor (ECF subfamily)
VPPVRSSAASSAPPDVVELPRQPFGEPAAEAGRAGRHLRAVPELQLDFEAAVRALTPRLQRYATRRLGDPHEAEELVQEALLRAYQHRHELRTEDDVAAWTTCVTGRLVVDRLRVRHRSTPMADVPEGRRSERDTADVVVARDQARMALDALDAMPPRQAAVLWAREVEGLGYDEIGRRFAMTEPAVRSLLTRARKGLRKEYAVRGGTLPGAGLAVLAPWVTGTGWLERLRAGLTKAAAPATLGIAAVGLVTSVLVLPAGQAPAATSPAVVVTAGPVAAAAPALPAAEPAAPAPEAAPESAVVAAAPVAPAADPLPASAGGKVLRGTGLSDTCVEAAGGGAGGTGCAPEPPADTLSLDVDELPLPGVAEAQAPHVQTNWLTCEPLPANPLTQCTPAREDS